MLSNTAPSAAPALAPTASVPFNAFVGTPPSDVSTNDTSNCAKEESAGHPSHQSRKRRAHGGNADGGSGKRASGGHGGGVGGAGLGSGVL